MAKRSGLKIVLIVLGVIVGLGVVGIGACVLSGYFWFQSNVPELRATGERMTREAREYAAAHTQSECIEEGFRRNDTCGTGMEVMCRTEARIFVDRCLTEATETPGLCEGVPPPMEIMQGATWALQYCHDHGHGQDRHCSNFVRAIVEYCGRPH